FVCQHQEEIRIALEKGDGQRGGRREERVVTAADTEHWHGHLIRISQWFVPLPVAVPVLGWVSPLAQLLSTHVILQYNTVPMSRTINMLMGVVESVIPLQDGLINLLTVGIVAT
uniref:Uncharacterized protein n=1 Tax=Seriola dumerili TaxID=41447 RepID=A0A3B4UWK6_SERDU